MRAVGQTFSTSGDAIARILAPSARPLTGLRACARQRCPSLPPPRHARTCQPRHPRGAIPENPPPPTPPDSSSPSPRVSQSLRGPLLNLFSLLALHFLTPAVGDLVEGALVSPAAVTAMRGATRELLARLRPVAVPLVDAFALSEHTLNSALGRYDGDVYRAMYEWAQEEPLNRSDVRSRALARTRWSAVWRCAGGVCSTPAPFPCANPLSHVAPNAAARLPGHSLRR